MGMSWCGLTYGLGEFDPVLCCWRYHATAAVNSLFLLHLNGVVIIAAAEVNSMAPVGRCATVEDIS